MLVTKPRLSVACKKRLDTSHTAKQDPIEVFPEMKLLDLVLNFHNHVSLFIYIFIYSHDRSTYFVAAK
jgi:hypothetical protein